MIFSFFRQLSVKHIFFVLISGVLLSCAQQEQHQIPELPDFDPSYYDYSLAVIDELLVKDPDNAEAYYRKAEILLQQNKANNALASIRKALELDDEDPVYHLTSAKVHLLKGQNQEAFKAAKTSLLQGKASVELYEILAQASLNSNYYTDALLYSDSALSLAPKNPANFLLKGKALAAIKDTTAAEDQFLKSLALGAQESDVYEGLVDMYMNTENYQKARMYMDKNLAQQKHKASDRMLFQQAQILRRVGDVDSAAAILYKVKEGKEVDAFSVNKELMNVYYGKNKYDSAQFYSEQMLVNRPNDKEALIAEARILDKKRSYQKAIDKYEEILETDSLQQQAIHKIAVEELEDLRRKVAYLWRRQQEEEFDKMKKGLAPLQPITPEE